ncbi:hypothetical protein RFF05_12690 [Bengtsoniella intestinalis]|uniref:hypothetical protein n=1 Tax=Bengtsoniella intestinalis TaxID=3073143 RepID=UPI00391F70E3
MHNQAFIQYLNTLHNVSADNRNAFTEENQKNPFFQKTRIDREVGQYIASLLLSSQPFIFILTGHAGDGKTGLLLQVLEQWHLLNDKKMASIDEITMPNNKPCTYIKDFSDDNASARDRLMATYKGYPADGKSVFLVANTGPLLSTFSNHFSKTAQIQLVTAIDENQGSIQLYDDIPIAVINVATIDNASFIRPFMERVLDESCWEKCAFCEKASYCPIAINRSLIKENFDRTISFIEKHYIWEQEHDRKLTIRQIVAHLSYSLTGGISCHEIKDSSHFLFQHLFFNVFFGYAGSVQNLNSAHIEGISSVLRARYDEKRLHANEQLFINRDFSIFPQRIKSILETEGSRSAFDKKWQSAVRRAYIMQNIDTNPQSQISLEEDIFSPWYPRFLKLRSGEKSVGRDNSLIHDALFMIFMGSTSKDKSIPITMKRDSGIEQSVQIVYETINKNKIKIEHQEINDFSTTKRYRLYLTVSGDRLTTPISLPLINYFNDTRNGAIATNIDPLLSHGIDSLKAQMIAKCAPHDDELELLYMNTSGWSSIAASFENGCWNIN